VVQDVLVTEAPKQEEGNVAGERINGRKKLKRVVSSKSIEANRGNALRSTGPRTRKGRNAVRWNALKHGLLAQSVVISSHEGEETAAQFRKLLIHLRKDLHPFRILEEILVEKIAVCYWRSWRVIRSETGEIREDLDSLWSTLYLPKKIQFQRAKDPESFRPFYDLQSNTYGIEFLLALLRKFKEEVSANGCLSEKSLQEMTRYFGDSEDELAGRYAAVNSTATSGENSAGSGESIDPIANSRQGILKILHEEILDEEIENLEEYCGFIRDQELQKLETERARLSLPGAAATEKILRYEVAIERQLYRAMNQLERRQRQRSGEAVPPPINIDVSGEK